MQLQPEVICHKVTKAQRQRAENNEQLAVNNYLVIRHWELEKLIMKGKGWRRQVTKV